VIRERGFLAVAPRHARRPLASDVGNGAVTRSGFTEPSAECVGQTVACETTPDDAAGLERPPEFAPRGIPTYRGPRLAARRDAKNIRIALRAPGDRVGENRMNKNGDRNARFEAPTIIEPLRIAESCTMTKGFIRSPAHIATACGKRISPGARSRARSARTESCGRKELAPAF
jgi:hypothetical protein